MVGYRPVLHKYPIVDWKFLYKGEGRLLIKIKGCSIFTTPKEGTHA